MACNQTLTGIARDCNPSLGGIVKVYATNFDDVKSVAVSDGKISTITLATSAKFKEYVVKRNVCSATSTRTIDPTTGDNHVETEIALSFARMDTPKRLELEALSLNGLALITLDANGLYWYYGKDEEVLATGATGSTGTARGDKNGFDITLSDISREFPYEVDSSIVEGLL